MIKTVLIIEDDEEIRSFLKKKLRDNNYAVLTASDGIEGLNLFHKKLPDLVVLDLGLPRMSGETVCQEIKKNYPDVPVIILTSKSQSFHVLQGFKMGADDYISKPFVAEEVVARIKARFKSQGNATILSVGDLVLNNDTFEVKRSEKLIPLTRKEFELLYYLMMNKGRVLSRDMILNKVWLYSPDIESRVIDVYMGYLRKKIDAQSKKKINPFSSGVWVYHQGLTSYVSLT